MKPTSWIPLTGTEQVAGEKDNAAEKRFPQPQTRHALIRPTQAASLLIVDRSGSHLRVLLGLRSKNHVFFPQTYVFPGGRMDRNDRATEILKDLHADEYLLMQAANGGKLSTPRCRALAVTALRETFEETGLMIGVAEPALDIGFRPDLSRLRYLARAITPPGQVRRFDTHFFMLFADEAGVNPVLSLSGDELEKLIWLDIHHGNSLPMPDITRKVLLDLQTMLENTDRVPSARQIPCYYTRYGRSVRELMQGITKHV